MATNQVREDLEKLRALPVREAVGNRVTGMRDPGAAAAWLMLPGLVELAAELGVPRDRLDVPRGVFVTRDGTLHVRSDSNCSRGSTYQKVRVTDPALMCRDCAHLRVDGRVGFETQPTLQRLAVLATVEHFLDRHRDEDLARRGMELEDVEREVLNLLDAALHVSSRSSDGSGRVLALTATVTRELTELRDSIPEICRTDEFRAAFEEQVRTYPGKGAPRHDELFGQPHRRYTAGPGTAVEGEQLLVVRKDGWQNWLWAATRAYPVLASVDNGWRDLVVLKVPGEVAGGLVEHLSSEIVDGPVPVPADPRLLETAVVLYTPMEGAFSTLAEALNAAELL